MYKVMITTLDSGEEGFCVKDDFWSEQEAQGWWDKNSAQYPEMTGMWIELMAGSEEFFQGWDELEATDAWDGES